MRLEVVPASGGLEAYLRFRDFDAEAFRSAFPDAESLRREAERQGILPECLDAEAVKVSHEMLSAGAADLAATEAVARGHPPEDEEVEGLWFHKAYLSAPEEIEAVKRRIVEEGFSQAETHVRPDCLVEQGEEILEYGGVRPGKLGRDVFGGTLPFKTFRQALPAPGSTVIEQGKKWVASARGVLALENNTLKILGAEIGKGVRIRVAPDRMSVHLVLSRAAGADFKPTEDLIAKLIEPMRFSPPPSRGAIRAVLQAFLEKGEEQDAEILAGLPMRPGRDGSLELLVDLEPNLPAPETTARVDFRAFTFFRSVHKGDVLARIVPPAEPEAGRDVYGNPVLPKPVFPFSRTLGRNTAAEGDKVIASCDGRLALVDGIPGVVETLDIGQDVSLKTGNVDFPGSIHVRGDVRDNLAIKARGDVDIAGVVEDSDVTSEGAIVVRGGFTGTGKGVIRSRRSSVTIGYIRNQRIESHSHIVVYNEVVNAMLLARKSIIMKSSGCSVLGGHFTAYESIEVFHAGGPTGVKTVLEVGKDFEVERELEETRRGLKEMQADKEYLEGMRDRLADLVRYGAQTGNEEVRLLEQRCRGVIGLLARAGERAAGKIRELEAKLFNPGDCHIWVKGTAWPGTVLRCRDKVYPVREEAQGKRWIFRGGGGLAPEDGGTGPAKTGG